MHYNIIDYLGYVRNIKDLMKESLVSKGVSVTDLDNFRSYVDKLSEIKYAPYALSFYGNNSRDLSRDLSKIDTRNMTSMQCMFYNCSNLESIDLSNFNMYNVLSTMYMFYNCTKLTTIDLSGLNFSNLTKTNYMFYGCRNLTLLDLSSINFSNLTSSTYMFGNNASSYVPSDCLIYVRTRDDKDYINSNFSRLTNVEVKEN